MADFRGCLTIIPMRDRLLLAVRKFLESRIIAGRPVLLGYSGGPDSKALLYLLLECRRFFPIEVHLAHVDHGWRKESREEAVGLQDEARRLGLPFYSKTLASTDFSPGNAEEQARGHRLQFFSTVYSQIDCQALVLGHHADDQAEVVLKRVFEGASLFNLGGLAQERPVEGMNIWRPLLAFPKKAILEWLEEKRLSFYQDPTNFSSMNLRGKMRQEILPALSQNFGKEIAANLCRLGEETQQLKEYFSALNEPILATLREEEMGSCLDLNPFFPLPALQLKFLLKEWMGREHLTLSHQIFQDMITALIERSSGKKFFTLSGHFLCDRGYLYFQRKQR